MPRAACSLEGCDRPVRALGLCGAHYARKRRLGEPGAAAVKKYPKKVDECLAEGCHELVEAKGYCQRHYWRLLRHGHIETDFLIGVRHPLWGGDDITYASAHDRVRRARGAASAYSCVDCGGPAVEWSYNHRCPREVIGQHAGVRVPFSPDPVQYDPRCIRCHRRFDAPVTEILR